jgi:hypothetical protein
MSRIDSIAEGSDDLDHFYQHAFAQRMGLKAKLKERRM